MSTSTSYLQAAPYYTHYKALVKLSIPTILGQLAMVLLSFFDTLMVGHYGTKELAAAAFVNSLMFLPLMFTMGVSMSLITLGGAAFGQNDTDKVGHYLRNSLMMNGAVMGVIVCIMLGGYFFLGMLGQDSTVLPYIRPYYLIQVASLPFAVCFFVGKSFTDSVTQPATSMCIIFGGVLLNILLNYLLIYGIGPFPELGLTGAGWGTFISRVFMAVSYVFLLQYAPSLKSYWVASQKAFFDKTAIKELFMIGWPVGTMIVMEASSFAMTTLFAGWISVTTMAAHQVMLSISQIFFMFYVGVGTAISVRSSIYYGQKDWANLKRGGQAGLHLMGVFVMINAVGSYLLRHQIGLLFTTDAEVLALIPLTMVPLMLYQVGDGLQMTYVNILRGVGAVQTIPYICFVVYILVSIPISYWLAISLGYGLPGIWMAFPIALTMAAIAFMYEYRRFLHKNS